MISRCIGEIKHVRNVRLGGSQGCPPVDIRRQSPLLVDGQCHVVVFDGFSEVPSLVLTSTTSIGCVYVSRVNLQDFGEVINTLINHLQLLEGTAADVVSTSVHVVQLHQAVAVVDRLLEHLLLQIAGSSNEQGLPMICIFQQLLAADCDQVIHVEGLPVQVGRPRQDLRPLVVCHHRRTSTAVDVFLQFFAAHVVVCGL